MSLQVSLDELVAKSGDSKLSHYSFCDGELKLVLDMEEFDATVKITIHTHALRVGLKSEAGTQADVFRTCRLELIELVDAATIENGFYVPAKNFGQMMKEVRRGVVLAYGERADQVGFLLNVTGYGNLVSCLVKQRNDITWSFDS